MYVRWKKRARKPTRQGVSSTLLTALLVKSRRIDGKPRQHIVAYLGGIQDTQLCRPNCCDIFWEGAEERLAALDLCDIERIRIVAALEDVVPQVPAEQSLAMRAQRRRTRAFVAELERRCDAWREHKVAHGGAGHLPHFNRRRIHADLKTELARSETEHSLRGAGRN